LKEDTSLEILKLLTDKDLKEEELATKINEIRSKIDTDVQNQ